MSRPVQSIGRGAAPRSERIRRHPGEFARGDARRLEPGGALRTVGGAGWDLYLNGNRIVNGWLTTTGPDLVGRIQIGDTAAKTWTANPDDVIVDGAAG